MRTRCQQDRIHRLEFDVEWPPGHVACYLLEGPEPILLDAGAPGCEAEFRRLLGARGYEPGDIEHVLLTHPHVDHIGLVPTVLGAGDSTVYAPAGVEARLEQDPSTLESRVRANCAAAGLPEAQLEAAVEISVGSLERNRALLPSDSVDVWMEPGGTTTVGDLEIGAVHVPGHQADHLSYPTTIDGERALLAGDVGIESFRPVVMHDGLDDGHREAFDAFYAALERLAGLEVDRVYPGHGPVHGNLAGTVRRDRESLDDRLDRVAGLVAEGHVTVPGVAAALAGDGEIKYLLPEAMSALARLERDGEVTVETTDGVRYYDA
jgi:glyoxylase-like metal-dependent hydrolase (beta-lactamase superfamily II)